MEKVADDSNYMQQNWHEGEMLQGSDDLQEILAQFESTAYLKDLNLFGGPMDPNGAGDKSKVDPVLSLPDVAFFHHLNDEEKQRHKRKLLNASGGGDPKDPPTKKGKIVVVEEQIESLTEGELAKRRESHNATERRRREKINEKIDELRKLLPGGGKGVNKAAVLHQTAERMKSLQLLFNRLVNEKRRLESSRNELLEDVYRLRTALAHYQQQHPASFGVGGPSNLPSLPPHAHPQTNILSQMPSPPSNQQSNSQSSATPLSVLPSHISHQALKM